MNTETLPLIPSYVVFQIGQRRVALPRESVGELIASPILNSFPHTSPLITGVVLRRGSILPVLDLAPRLVNAASLPTRFYLVVERNISGSSERCAIPVQGACELVTGTLLPVPQENGIARGCLDLDGQQIEVLDLEKTIMHVAEYDGDQFPGAEATS